MSYKAYLNTIKSKTGRRTEDYSRKSNGLKRSIYYKWLFANKQKEDEEVTIAPILPGSGTRLFEKENNRIIELTKIKVVETPG